MPKETVKIHVDLAGLGATFGARIQHLADLVRTGLDHGSKLQKWAPEPFEGKVTYGYGRTGPWTSEQVQDAWRRWILSNGFRDLAELASEFLEAVQDVLAKWELQLLPTRGIELKTDHWNEIVVARFDRFHKMGFPAKLDFLRATYQFAPDLDFVDFVQTINKVRNCMVHSNGRVRPQDCNDGDALTLRWHSLAILITDGSDKREASVGEELPPGALLGMGHQPRSKSFPVRSRVGISQEEFEAIAWTVRRFGSSMVKQLETHGRAQGIRFRSDGPAENSSGSQDNAT